MNCPYCNEPMELIRDGKYWWHINKASNFRNPKAMTCPITAVTNLMKKETAVCPSVADTVASLE